MRVRVRLRDDSGATAVIVAILILVRLWMRQIGPVETDPNEIRTIDRGDEPSRAGHASRRRRRATPAEHARRLRDDGVGALGLDLLAADYALARFGGVSLGDREDRRAVGRWRHLRSRLGKG